MSKRDRHDNDRRGERRDSQPEEEQQRRPSESDLQEGDSLTALKAILSKVAALLNPLHLTQEESIRLVEQLYESVLETDVRLAGEADDTRKSSVLAQIQNTTVTREGGRIVVQYANVQEPAPQTGEAQQAKEPSPASPSSGGSPSEPSPDVQGQEAVRQPLDSQQQSAAPAKEPGASKGKARSASSPRSAGPRGPSRRGDTKPAGQATVMLGTDPAVADLAADDQPSNAQGMTPASDTATTQENPDD